MWGIKRGPRRLPTRSKSKSRTSPYAIFVAAIVAAALLTPPALADGGQGGDSDGSAGGAGGQGFEGNTGDSGTGQGGGGGGAAGGATSGGAGGQGAGNLGGGGGGAGGTAATPNGQPGADGNNGIGGGGGGGGGGFNGNGAGDPSINNSSALTGGDGGRGGNGGQVSGIGGGGGGGGSGGLGAVITGAGASTNSGTITAGNGGEGGASGGDNASVFGGDGGDGGEGVRFTAQGASFTNSGSVTGGNGGAAGAGANQGSPGHAGAGGAGITGAGLTIINSGTIAGGLSGDGTIRANAITFTGGNNLITFNNATSGLTGNVDVTGSLTFDQSTDTTITNVIAGTGSITKTGAGTLVLNGNNAYSGGTTIEDGTLRLGSSNAAGTGAITTLGSVMDYAVGVTINNPIILDSDKTQLQVLTGTATQAGDISEINGPHPLEKIGNGTLVLSGNNTYTGATLVSAGELVLSSSTALNEQTALTVQSGATVELVFNVLSIEVGSIAGGGRIEADAPLQFFNWGADNTDTTFSGELMSFFSLKEGTGTTTLSGSNDIDVLTITDGSIRIGAGGSLGDTFVSFLDGGTPTLDLDGNDLDIQAISGAESARILLGDGTLTLTDGAGDFFGVISGSGNLIKEGFGALALHGDNTFTGSTSVDQGTLTVNGSIANSATTVENGAILMGTGQLGAATVNSGGVHAPGNSIGTQGVAGDFTLNSDAVLQIEAAPGTNNSDRVVVTNNGTVNLTGAILQVLAQNGNYAASTTYLIIDNDGNDPVNGQFAQVTTNLAFLTWGLDYAGGTGNDVVLTLERLSFLGAAHTRNQRAVAGALDQVPTTSPLFFAVFNQTADGARQAFNALSGEIHATLPGTLADDSRYVREAVLGRLMQANATNGRSTHVAALGAGGPQVVSLDQSAMTLGHGDRPLAAPQRERLAFWTRAYGAWGDFEGDGNAATADRDLGGFISGMDANIGGAWRVGLATGASFSNISVDDRFSSADVETYHLGGYLGGMAGAFALRGGGAYAWSDIDTSRAVIFPSFFERQNASYDADTGQLFGEIAYPAAMGGMAVEPFAGLAYVSIDSDTIRERGGPLASLRGSADQDVGYSTLGLRAATTMHWGAMEVTPHVSAAWQHAFDDVTPEAALAFASTGIGFDIEGVPLAEDTALIDAGLDFALGANTTAGVSYSGQFGDGVSDNGVRGRFSWLF